MRGTRSRRTRGGLALLAVAATLSAAGWGVAQAFHRDAPASCAATAGGTTITLTPEQARNATTIAAVALREHLPGHAVTVALATALQESGLENLDYGDRDSVGLFQQRPSQGWGTRTQVSDPAYASSAFFRHLAQVPGWQQLAVTVAAQRVQRSAAPSAYGQWEPQARLLARAFTGELPAAFTCSGLPRTATAGTLAQHAARELGTASLSGRRTPAAGWTTAAWLVARSGQGRLDAVSYGGQTWTAASGRWATSTMAPELLAVSSTPRNRS